MLAIKKELKQDIAALKTDMNTRFRPTGRVDKATPTFPLKNMATKKPMGRPPKPAPHIPDTFENIIKTLVKPVKEKPA